MRILAAALRFFRDAIKQLACRHTMVWDKEGYVCTKCRMPSGIDR